MTAGGSTPACPAFWAMSPNVPRTAMGLGAQPPERTAAGVAGSFPGLRQPPASSSSLDRPMRKTSVPDSPASFSRSRGRPSAAVWAVTM